MSQPTILCAAYGGGHVNACLPVAMALSARGWTVHFLALTTAYAVVDAAGARDAGVTIWQVNDMLTSDDAEIVAHGTRLVGDVDATGPVSRVESVAYQGLGYCDLVATHGHAKAQSLYADAGRAAFEHGELAARILNKTAPDIILTTNSPRAEKALIDAGQDRGITAIVLNDTLASATNHWLHYPDYADRILVLSQSVADTLIASGHTPEKIIVTGNPAFEPMAQLRARRAAPNARAQTDGNASPNGRKTVLYASQPLKGRDADHQSDVIAALYDLALQRDDWDVRVRLHPNEEPAPAWLKPPFRCNRSASLDCDLFDADAVITHGSTLGIEAALAGVPVILQMGSSVAQNSRFAEYGIGAANADIDDLETAIDRAVSQTEAGRFAMPSGALGNVVEAIDAMFAEAQHA
ncbi:MAG: hypothetical protein ABJN35_12765 [Erythrobacter sp.]